MAGRARDGLTDEVVGIKSGEYPRAEGVFHIPLPQVPSSSQPTSSPRPRRCRAEVLRQLLRRVRAVLTLANRQSRREHQSAVEGVRHSYFTGPSRQLFLCPRTHWHTKTPTQHQPPNHGNSKKTSASFAYSEQQGSWDSTCPHNGVDDTEHLVLFSISSITMLYDS